MNHKTVICKSKCLLTKSEKIDFLTLAVEYYVHCKKFKEAGQIAKYIIRSIDSESVLARKILFLAKLKEVRHE